MHFPQGQPLPSSRLLLPKESASGLLSSHRLPPECWRSALAPHDHGTNDYQLSDGWLICWLTGLQAGSPGSMTGLSAQVSQSEKNPVGGPGRPFSQGSTPGSLQGRQSWFLAPEALLAVS